MRHNHHHSAPARQEHKKREHLPDWAMRFTEEELRGIVISKVEEDLKPLRDRFSVQYGYDEQGKFFITARER